MGNTIIQIAEQKLQLARLGCANSPTHNNKYYQRLIIVLSYSIQVVAGRCLHLLRLSELSLVAEAPGSRHHHIAVIALPVALLLHMADVLLLHRQLQAGHRALVLGLEARLNVVRNVKIARLARHRVVAANQWRKVNGGSKSSDIPRNTYDEGDKL